MSRRLVVAEWQNVVYGEYLPAILGGKAIRRHRLAHHGSAGTASAYSANKS